MAQPFDNLDHAAPTITYQWYANGVAVSGSAGKASTFTPSASYAGKKITVKLTGSSELFATASVTSSPLTLDTEEFANYPTPVITSPTTLEAGVKASVTVGDYGATGITYKYVWLRSTDGGTSFAPISGATKSTYTPVATDGGDYLEVKVTASKTGYHVVPQTSTQVLISYPAELTALAAPELSGSGMVGDALALTSGTWNVPALSYSYQWYRNDVAIPGATSSSWIPTATSVNDEITATVTASRVGYAPVRAGSNAVSVTPSDALRYTGDGPEVTQAGSMLTATPGTWSIDGVTITYQWHDADGNIPGATGESYELTGDEPGLIEVIVTASHEGYVSVSVGASP